MTTTPVCAYSLVKEGTPYPFLDYDSSNLQRCSRCKGTWYAKQDTLKKQWKIHMKCCKPLSADTIADIERRDLERIEDYLMEDIRRPGGYPEMYYILKRLLVLYDDDVDSRAESACRLPGAVRGIVVYPQMR
jgi:hypothetical protein